MSRATRTRHGARNSTRRRNDLEKGVALILARLPEVERRVLTRRLGLHDGAVTSTAEVGRQLGMHPSEVAAIETRAMQRLRTLVGPDTAREMLAAAS